MVLRLAHPLTDGLALTSAVEERQFAIEGFAAFDDRGRRLEVRKNRRPVSTPNGPIDLSYFQVVATEPLEHITVRYEARPGIYLPPGGEPDLRRFGRLDGEGCLLSMLGPLVLPEAPLGSVEVDVLVPAEWRVVERPPTRLEGPAVRSLTDGFLIAGRYEEPRQLTCGVDLVPTRTTSEALFDQAATVVATIEELLGPAKARVRIAAMPPASDGLLTDLCGTIPYASIDSHELDLGSTRRLIRQLVPLWYGKTSYEMETDRSPEAWFLLGLSEYLARLVPDRARLLPRNWEAELETLWMLNPELAESDLRSPGAPSLRGLLERRAAAAVRVHLLVRGAGGPAQLATALGRYLGTGCPPFARTRGVAGPAPWDWDLDLQEHPKDPGLGNPRTTIHLICTANAAGTGELCTCPLAKGQAERRAALHELLDAREDPILVELGPVAPLELGMRRLDAAGEEALRSALEARSELGFDAVVIAPADLYSGSDQLRPSAAPHDVPVLGCGTTVDGAPLQASQTVKSGGLEVGLIGFSENAELGVVRECQEQNLRGVRFPHDLESVRAEIEQLRSEGVELIGVAGHLRPHLVRELASPPFGVDFVVVGGPVRAARGRDHHFGFVDNTAVLLWQGGADGIEHVTLFVTDEGRIDAIRGG
ncbi:MAG: hypothetical protein AAF682_14455 [Planctomycetota bacterium]